MHPILLESLQRLQEYYAQDERCLGMYLSGSIGAGTTDEWSDVDADAVFRDEDYPTIKAEIRAVCEAQCGPLLVWLPEGESEDNVNYAFLFEAGGRSHLFDFAACRERFIRNAPWLRPQRILFDRTGLLAKAMQRTPVPCFNPADLLHQINIYYVYAYLSGKYFRRGDVYKMMYVQQVIFQAHLRVLNAFYPQAEWNWWARDIHALSPEQQTELLVYFGSNQCQTIAGALQNEMNLFSRDAQAACERYALRYPVELERGVREHFTLMGLTTQDNH